MDTVLQDLRFAVRTLRRSPGFTLAALLTLGLGIGANSAIFSLVNGVLLRPLPYGDDGRLFFAFEQSTQNGSRLPSYPTFRDWEAAQNVFSGIAYTRGAAALHRGPDGPEHFLVAFVSPQFFSTLQAGVHLGRMLAPDDDREGGHVIVLGYRLWRRKFGGDPQILGRSVALDDATYTVVGVAAEAVRYPGWADAWIPIAAIAHTDPALRQRGIHVDSRVIARLAPGVSQEQAQEAMSTIAGRLALEYPEHQEGWTGVGLTPLKTEVLGFGTTIQTRLQILGGAVVLVLLIACANVTNLLLARALARSREIAIRTALGAGSGRVIRQLLTESLVLAMAGGTLGTGIAVAGVGVLRRLAPDALPRLGEVTLDGWVLAFAAGASLLTALFVGVVPALRAASRGTADALRGTSAGAGVGRTRLRFQRAVVTGEIATAVVLAAGAGLLIKSLWKLETTRPGFEPTGLVTIDLTPPAARYPGADGAARFYRTIHDAVRRLPDVHAASLTNFMPLGAWIYRPIEVPGSSESTGDPLPPAIFRAVTPDYFATMQIAVRQGRAFAEADLDGAPVAILSETAAQRYFPAGDAIGRAVRLVKSAQGREDLDEPFLATVVGVVGDVRHRGLDQPPDREVYVPYTVNPWTHMVLVTRATGDPDALIPTLRRSILEVDPDVAVSAASGQAGFRTSEDLWATALASRRLSTGLLGAFALAALTLAAIGIAGLMAYHVAQRRREMGIRVALGASPRQIRGLVLRDGLRLTAIGLTIGIAVSAAATRALTTQLFEVTPTDPWTFATMVALLTGIALAAAWVPGWKAGTADPMIALRSD